MTARCWAEVSRGALRHNVAVVRENIGPRAGLMAVVKANGYGHGVADLVRTLREEVQMFGVANLHEAREVRAVVATEIMILGAALPEERAAIVREGFLAAVSSFAEAQSYAAVAGEKPARLHLAVDTGMGRMGVWQEEAADVFRKIQALAGVQLTGLATHLPAPDEDTLFTQQQLARFAKLARELGTPFHHALNSGGVLAFPAQAGDLVRAGLVLYGSAPIREHQPRLRPALTWKTRIILLRDVPAGRGVSYGRTFITPEPMRIATLAAGYADGYQRRLSNRGAHVLIGGQRCAVLGRVTMDQIMVDVSHVPAAAIGEEAVLLGRQGGEEILAVELAEKAGTIAWEIFTSISYRVARVYLE